MIGRREREAVRRLSESRPSEPPAGLLERIVAEIPVAVVVGDEAARLDDERRSPTPRQRWLIAASLLAVLGAGLFSLRLFDRSAPLFAPPDAGKTATTPPTPAAAPPEALGDAAPETGSPMSPAAPAAPAAPARQALRVAPPPPPPPVSSAPGLDADAAVGGVEGGVAGGVAGGALPPPAAPKLERLPPQPVVAQKEAPASEPAGQPVEETVVVTNEAAPLPAPVVKAAGDTGDTGALPAASAASRAKKKTEPAVGLAKDRRATDTPAGSPVDTPLLAARNPFASGGYGHLIAVDRHASGISGAELAKSAEFATVELGPAVARSRRLGGGAQELQLELWEIELVAGAAPDAVVATLGAGDPAADGSRSLPTVRTLRVAQLAPAFTAAPPQLRRAAIAAELAEILHGSRPKSGLRELRRQARRLAQDFPGDRQAAELVRAVDAAAGKAGPPP